MLKTIHYDVFNKNAIDYILRYHFTNQDSLLLSNNSPDINSVIQIASQFGINYIMSSFPPDEVDQIFEYCNKLEKIFVFELDQTYKYGQGKRIFHQKDLNVSIR